MRLSFSLSVLIIFFSSLFWALREHINSSRSILAAAIFVWCINTKQTITLINIKCRASVRTYFYKCATAIRKQLNKYLRFLRALFDCFFFVVFIFLSFSLYFSVLSLESYIESIIPFVIIVVHCYCCVLYTFAFNIQITKFHVPYINYTFKLEKEMEIDYRLCSAFTLECGND